MKGIMANNPGVYPVDPTTEIGQMRLLLGDTQAEEFDPPIPGTRNYENFSDAELESFLANGGSLSQAMGLAYLSLAGRAAAESESIKDYDLAVDTTKKATDYRNLAELWFGRAGADDASAAEDAFVLVPTGSNRRACRPELAAWSFR